jgi:hypothetical protein
MRRGTGTILRLKLNCGEQGEKTERERERKKERKSVT